MKRYKVSVITRTKSRTVLLRRAIESVLGQTFQDWIMVIVNDGGEKEDVNTLVAEYKAKFLDRCIIVHNDSSLGMEAASNCGLKASDSDYVVIHDDDDSWHPLFLEKCVQFLDSNHHHTIAGVITHSVRVLEKIVDNKLITEQREPFNSWLKAVSFFRMCSSNLFPPISFVYERKVLDEIGFYNEDFPVLGDWEFNLRFIRKYDIYLIPEELAFYHQRLSITNGNYSNSVVADDNKHKFYDALLRNEMLRKDLESNSIGMGYLLNISRGFGDIHSQIFPFERFIDRIKRINWLRKLAKNFLWKSPR